MSGKNQSPIVFNWQTTSPAASFLPPNNNTVNKGSVPSGTEAGSMATTIYSQILDVSRMDNIGLDIDWTGTPTGVIAIMVSNTGGNNFKALTFNPVLDQPAGSAAGIVINLNQLPFKYLMIKYTSTSGSGSLRATGQQKDLN